MEENWNISMIGWHEQCQLLFWRVGSTTAWLDYLSQNCPILNKSLFFLERQETTGSVSRQVSPWLLSLLTLTVRWVVCVRGGGDLGQRERPKTLLKVKMLWWIALKQRGDQVASKLLWDGSQKSTVQLVMDTWFVWHDLFFSCL